jgi:hypothetical protein
MCRKSSPEDVIAAEEADDQVGKRDTHPPRLSRTHGHAVWAKLAESPTEKRNDVCLFPRK